MDLVAMLPWWGGVALALVAYLVLHQFAAMPKPGALQPGQMGDFVVKAMLRSLAYFGQFVVPALCLLGALISFLRRRKREALIGNVTQSSSAEALNGMSWREFEMLVGEAFRLQGYKVIEEGGAQADGGVDLRLRKGTERFLVQCKQWRARKVSVEIVRELYGVMAAEGAAGGFVITSGDFTSDARAFAEGRDIKLVDGPKLFALIKQAKASVAEARAGTASKTAPLKKAPASDTGSTPQLKLKVVQVGPVEDPVTSTNDDPECPACGSPMIRRTAKKGANAGTQFWGCSRYPACRGTR